MITKEAAIAKAYDLRCIYKSLNDANEIMNAAIKDNHISRLNVNANMAIWGRLVALLNREVSA